uniref:Uncharacterized protein LOC117348877 isoform X2 n=1 Tax=Geotrypetes seraphini TaxID=260995 RepID=A0A6P8NMK9_GEOSA|nr:uncharacterized protein LOC117348877 isoform X2 [Geotrypetes seraphini]
MQIQPAGEPNRTAEDSYYLMCLSEGITCHPKAVCQLDKITNSFYCQCLPGHVGDGINYCQEPAVKVTVFNESICDGTGKQVCLLKKMPGENATLRVSVEGTYTPDQITWYKLYSSEGPGFHSYRERLSPDLLPGMGLTEDNQALRLYHINENDFYPNKFWVEMEPYESPSQLVKIEPYDFTGFDLLNPSQLRYFFVLERMPIEIGEFLEGDTIVIELSRYLNVSPSSFVQWVKEPKNWTLLGTESSAIANRTQELKVQGVTHQDFGYVRAIVYDYIAKIPVKVMVAQRLFLLKKDISKVCQGPRSENNCKCNPGFEGNGIHCVDTDECLEGMPLTCLPQASCINTYGSYACWCPEGYEGDGLHSCIDRDECATGAYYCNPKTICVNTLGSYVCVCQSGLIGIGNHCRERSVWTPWSPWSICALQCEHRNQMRIRLCTHPESGMRCQGPSVELRPCPVKTSCPVDGSWSEWSPWSICSDTCSGLKKRIRLCNSPAPAMGGLPCPGQNEVIAMCKSVTCPVDGIWSPWTAWTPCPLSCGLAVVSRSRQCNNPGPAYGGEICSGTAYEEGSCGFPEEFCKYLVHSLGRFVPGKLIH